MDAAESTPLRPSGHHPAFLVYPCIYMITGTPVLLGSLIPALERTPIFMGVAGALLAATGLLDSALWSSIILFSNKDDIHNSGLDHFTFLRTPEGRTLGNIVLVQGGNENWKRASWHSKKKDQGWWRLGEHRNSSQASLTQQVLGHEQGIHLDIVTTVVVEGEVNDLEDIMTYIDLCVFRLPEVPVYHKHDDHCFTAVPFATTGKWNDSKALKRLRSAFIGGAIVPLSATSASS
ncbi:hypothetical protein SLS53_003898 [Cytospora paraplurivora]|uniref:Uncharacterized protein n=1 Tax=Cytospora paraplurivora TaxID=2898453 RepID=A0AAN9UC29_9PEZI